MNKIIIALCTIVFLLLSHLVYIAVFTSSVMNEWLCIEIGAIIGLMCSALVLWAVKGVIK